MDRILTKTLAEIYLQQGHLQEAFEMFKALAEKDPSDLEIQKRLNELRERLHSLSKEEKLRNLEKWLANIQKQKGS
jgi:predicted Zn-dependent protease